MTHSDISNPENSENTTRGICLPFSVNASYSFLGFFKPLSFFSLRPTSRLILKIVYIFIPDDKQDVPSTLFSA